MDLARDEIETLLRLQHVDMELLRSKKQLDELPQRSIILAARQKRGSIIEKQAKAAALRRETNKKLIRITDEDASLAKKQQGVQAALEAAQGDYRNVEARAKELDGLARRRGSLAEDLDKVSAEFEKIEGVEAQIAKALEELDAREAAAVASFQKEGGALKMGIMKLEEERARLEESVSKDVLSVYEKAAARSGGVAVSRLEGSRCGACRTNLEGGRLIELKSQAPLGTCPSCKRLLIIE